VLVAEVECRKLEAKDDHVSTVELMAMVELAYLEHSIKVSAIRTDTMGSLSGTLSPAQSRREPVLDLLRGMMFRKAFGTLLVLLLTSAWAQGATPRDAIDLFQATIYNSPSDLASWARTATITSFSWTPGVMRVDFDKRVGPGRWPDTPFGAPGDSLEYSLGICLNIGGQWDCSAPIQFWFGRDIGATTNMFNWFYDTGRWGPLVGHQPAPGELVGIFVGQGNLRGVKDHSGSSVLERSNVLLVPFPGNDSGVFPITYPPARTTALDFDGDGKADIGVFRPSTSQWFGLLSSTNFNTSTGVSGTFGNPGDIPVPRDYDGDGKMDLAVFRPSDGTWYIGYSSTLTTAAFQWGNGLDVPVPGDYDGDGKTDIAVFRPSDGTWYIRYSGSGTSAGFQWGNGLDVPVPGDYDGDGKTDIAVFRPSNGTWYLWYSGSGTVAGFQWGNGSDVPVSSDYDGDGKTDIAVFRPSNGTWYIVYSSTGSAVGFQWGNGSDVPVPADYDGDGRTDIAVFRPSNGTWYLVYSGTATAAGFQWGNGLDIPIPRRP
jgi:VCBS repeat protein